MVSFFFYKCISVCCGITLYVYIGMLKDISVWMHIIKIYKDALEYVSQI